MDLSAPETPKTTNSDEALVQLVELLAGIDGDSPLAALNAISISDNNGSRILL